MDKSRSNSSKRQQLYMGRVREPNLMRFAMPNNKRNREQPTILNLPLRLGHQHWASLCVDWVGCYMPMLPVLLSLGLLRPVRPKCPVSHPNRLGFRIQYHAEHNHFVVRNRNLVVTYGDSNRDRKKPHGPSIPHHRTYRSRIWRFLETSLISCDPPWLWSQGGQPHLTKQLRRQYQV